MKEGAFLPKNASYKYRKDERNRKSLLFTTIVIINSGNSHQLMLTLLGEKNIHMVSKYHLTDNLLIRKVPLKWRNLVATILTI